MLKRIKDFFTDEKNVVFVLSLLFLIFILLIYYPGIMTFDGNIQWEQVISGNIDNVHPFISTYFMYLLSLIYQSPIMIILFQIIVTALTFSYLYSKIKIQNKWLKYLTYIIIITHPIIAIFSITIWKDILYSYYLLISGLLIYDWSLSNFDVGFKKKYFIGIILALVYSYRVNGIIVSILTIFIILLLLIKNKKNFKEILIVPFVFIITLLVFSIPKHYYLSRIEDNSEKESSRSVVDNYMLWITGSYLNYGDVNEEEIEFLSSIYNIDEWKNHYNPYLINSSNEMEIDNVFFSKNHEKFQSVFINISKRNISTLALHYFKADSLLISPVTLGYVYTFDFSDWEAVSSFNSKINPKIPYIHNYYDLYINGTLKLPVFKYFYTPANILYISFILIFVVYKKKKDKRIFILLLPMVLNTISLLPVNIAQDLRYVYINYLTFPWIIITFMNCLSKKNGDIIINN